MLADTDNKPTSSLTSAKSRRWLVALLISFGLVLAVVGDETPAPADTPETASPEPSETETSKTLWQAVPKQNSPANKDPKWQRPDSKRNEALLKQSISGDFWQDSGNSPKAKNSQWQRPASKHNNTLINEVTSTREGKSFWPGETPKASPAREPGTPFDIEDPLTTAESPLPKPEWYDTTPIPQRFKPQGPESLAQALLLWGTEYASQLVFSPRALVSAFYGNAKNYYQDFKNPYQHPLTVTEAFLDIHSGPGQGYPKFYIAEHSELVYLRKYQSDWYQVELKNAAGQTTIKGWMPDAVINAALANEFPEQNKLAEHGNWFVGTAGGTFAGETMLQAKLGYFFSDKIWAEFAVSEVLENLSNSTLQQINLLHQPLGQKTFSPFFGLGFGYFKNKPFQTTINQQDSESAFMNVNIGLHWYLSERLLLRGDFKNYVLALNDDAFDSHQEYSAGFSVFWDSTAPRGIKLGNDKYIDRDDIELGLFAGNLALEDFETAQVSGLLVNYHFSEYLFIESRYASADIPTNAINSFFNIFNPDSKLPLNYYSLGLGLNTFTGEAVLNRKRSVQSTTYVTAAVGSTEFLERRFFTIQLGAGLMLTPLESWNIKFEIQDLIFEQDIFGVAKQTHNLALQTGLSLRF